MVKKEQICGSRLMICKKKINSVGVEVSFIQQEVINKVKNHLAVLIP
jgi:hypothetical protein